MPVCGCDGTIHLNTCSRRAFSVQVDPAMRCAVPVDAGGGLVGGCLSCDSATQYCEMKRVGPLDPPYFAACRPLPAACGASPTACDCLADVPCGAVCNTLVGFPIVTCYPTGPGSRG
jgi:hypothetical protein